MKRQTTEEILAGIREELHEIRDALSTVTLRVDKLWEERQRQKAKAMPEEVRR